MNCFEECQVQVQANASKGLEYIERIPDVVCGHSIDQASSQRKALRQKIIDDEQKGMKKSKQEDELINLGLPPIEQHYEIDRTASVLSFGSGLQRWVHKKTRMPRAVLTLSKENIPKDVSAAALDSQLQSLCKIDHPNIVPFREVCEDPKHVRLVYEWCEGGPLLHQLWRYEGMLTEGHIAQIIRELLSALVAADVFGVHHLDLGLFSLFLQSAERLSPIRVFGFGLSGFLMPQVAQRKLSRTNKHCYCSPEMFNSSVKGLSPVARHASDVWSVGCILYTFCCGRPPFGLGSIKDVGDRVKKGKWELGLEFEGYTSMLRDVLEAMLVTDWRKRHTANLVLKLGWVQRSATLQLKDGQISQVALSQLQSYAHADHVKQTVARMLTDIGLTSSAYADLEEKFREMDLNGDGTITLGELVTVSSSLGISEADMKQIIGKLDRNGNCNVDITEFISALVMEQDSADERLIRKAFSKMDRNGDARVTKKELFTVLRQYSGTVETDEVSNFVGKADDDGDQKIDYREFMGLFPQVRGRYEEINNRWSNASYSIQCTTRWFSQFKDAIQPWRKKVEQLRDKIEYACEAQEIPEHLAAGASYSYVKGHIQEFDVQVMIKDLASALHHVPGSDLGKSMGKRGAARGEQRKSLRQRMEERRAVKVEGAGQQMMGMAILSKAKDKLSGKERKYARNSMSGSGESGSESGDEDKIRANATKGSALDHFSSMIDFDIKTRKGQLDSGYSDDAFIFLALHWMIRVRSQHWWQLPLLDVLRDLRTACVEDVIEVPLRFKADLVRIVSALDDRYIMRETIKVEDNDIVVKEKSRCLPMGVLHGKNLKMKQHLEKLQDVQLPTLFYFGYPKDDVTAQRIEYMHNQHQEKMIWVGRFATQCLAEVDELFKGVEEDLLMMTSLEDGIPSPPPMSHEFLKYCEGRGRDADVHTPRIEDGQEVESSSDEEPVLGQTMASASAADLNADGTVATADGSTNGLTAATMRSSQNMNSQNLRGSMGEKHRGKRIERNQVLTKTHQKEKSKK